MSTTPHPMPAMNPATIPDYPVDTDIPLEAQGSWPASVHRFDYETTVALRAAEASGRPLLIRGKPGVGKSQTARAAAAGTRRRFLSGVIDGRTEPHDLMWRFDAVRRLADAQQSRALSPDGSSLTLPPESDYLRPEALWWAYHWTDAETQARKARSPTPPQPARDTQAPPLRTDRAVLLIDEIDKADPDLPNALLEVLANQGFTVPGGDQPVTCTPASRPLILITTNEERELPAAFLRRCLVLTLELPEEPAKLISHLVTLGQRHQVFQIQRGLRSAQATCSEAVMREAAGELAKRRIEADRQGLYLPGTAEFLDLVGALATLWPVPEGRTDNDAQQLAQLATLRKFALRKDATPTRRRP